MTRTHRALVVDDDPSMVKTLSAILELKGWEVRTALNGRAAVEAASGGDFDVVLMDIKMPEMDGVAAFKAMKAARPDVRVVLMTAYAAQELMDEAVREGVVQIMSKPVNIPSLLSLLAGSLKRKQPVLLVDSDLAFLKTLSETLRLRGFETVIASSIDDAMRLMNEQKPAAVLLHMHIGSVSALDAVVAVHDVSPSVALVLYSGRPDAEEELQQALPGEYVHAYLQKPFAVEQVTGVLNAIGAG